MDPASELRSQKYLYLVTIGEPSDNQLRFTIDAAEVLRDGRKLPSDVPIIGVAPIEPTPQSPRFEVQFDSYIAYSVRNESFVSLDRTESWSGGLLFREYSRSKFLDYVTASTFATAQFPAPFTHFGFCCLNHVVDVASTVPPAIRVILR